MMFTKRQAAILHTLQQTRPRERNSIIGTVDSDIIRLLSEMCFNLLRGNVRLNATQVKRLKRHKRTIRTLANRTLSIKEKRRKLQLGGFLPLVLPVISAALGGLLTSS